MNASVVCSRGVQASRRAAAWHFFARWAVLSERRMDAVQRRVISLTWTGLTTTAVAILSPACFCSSLTPLTRPNKWAFIVADQHYPQSEKMSSWLDDCDGISSLRHLIWNSELLLAVAPVFVSAAVKAAGLSDVRLGKLGFRLQIPSRPKRIQSTFFFAPLSGALMWKRFFSFFLFIAKICNFPQILHRVLRNKVEALMCLSLSAGASSFVDLA